jgi:hypothetical protein
VPQNWDDESEDAWDHQKLVLGQSKVMKMSGPLGAPTKIWIILALEAFGLSASSKENSRNNK